MQHQIWLHDLENNLSKYARKILIFKEIFFVSMDFQISNPIIKGMFLPFRKKEIIKNECIIQWIFEIWGSVSMKWGIKAIEWENITI